MIDVDALEHRIRQKLQAAELKRELHGRHTRQQMVETEKRISRFNSIADRVLESILRPRLEMLPRYFDNAEFLEPAKTDRHHCVCVFRRTNRYPATTRLDLAVCSDGHIESVLITYRLEIRPVFFQFGGHDQRAFPLENVDEDRVAEWVDAKLAAFIDTYVWLEHADLYQRENMVRDPVCGMAVNKSWAPARLDHNGRTYYFCIDECRQEFAKAPERYSTSSR